MTTTTRNTMRKKKRLQDPATVLADAGRRNELRQLLHERRRDLVATLQNKSRGVRAEHAANATQGGLDEEETSELNVQTDIEIALLEMKAETLALIDNALARLDAGLYGHCDSCGRDIASSRLRAQPFAVRCRDCEALNEAGRERERTPSVRTSRFMEPADRPNRMRV
jgi:RNA polymerase-binding transcription factor